MKTTFILVCMLIVSSVFTFARNGWERLEAENRACARISIERAVIVGEDGKILLSTDGGKGWSRQESPLEEELEDVDFGNSLLGIAVGDNGAIVRSTDGGVTWSIADGGVSDDLSSVDFVSNKVAYAIGSRKIIKSTDGGKQWKVVRESNSDTLTCIDFVNETQGTVVGWNGLILQTSNGGTTWQARESNTKTHLYSVSFQDEARGLIGGFGMFLNTVDGGNSWSAQQAPLQSPIFDVKWISSQSAVAGSGPRSILQTNDGGNSWSVVNFGETLSNSTFFSDIAILNSSEAVVVGSNNTILKTNNSGSDWEILAHFRIRIDPITPLGLNALKYFSDQHAVLVGEKGTVYLSKDGGTTWLRKMTGLRLSYTDIHIVNAESGFAIGNAFGSIVRTSDSGNTWVQKNEVGEYKYVSVFFMNDRHGFMLADTSLKIRNPDLVITSRTVLLETIDGGLNWEVKHFPGLRAAKKIQFVDRQTGFILAEKFRLPGDDRLPRLLRTTNTGKSWDTLETGSDRYLHDMDFIDEQNGFLSGENGYIVRTRDGGDSWDQVNSGTSQQLQSIAFLNENLGFIVGQLPPGTALVTTDGGNTWHSEQVHDPHADNASARKTMYEIACPNDTTVYLMGLSTLVRKYFPGTISNVAAEGRQTALNKVRLHTSPNPTDSRVRITFSGFNYIRSSNFALRLINAVGRSVSEVPEMSLRIVENGTAGVEIDMEHLHAGAYYLICSLDGVSLASSMIVKY